jgi:hypothetical protein
MLCDAFCRGAADSCCQDYVRYARALALAGRPTKLDDLVSKRICDALAAGTTRRAAAEAARIDQATLCEWLARGRNGDEPFAEFRQRVQHAEARAERKVVDRLMDQIDNGHVTAIIFWLKSRRGWRDNDAPANEAPAAATVASEDTEELLEDLLEAARSRKVAG